MFFLRNEELIYKRRGKKKKRKKRDASLEAAINLY